MISLQVMCFTHEELKRLLTKFVIIKNEYYERAKSCVFTCEDVKRLPTKIVIIRNAFNKHDMDVNKKF